MTNQKFSTFSLLDIPSREREVFLYLSRNGPCEAASIAAALGRDIADIQSALAALEQRGRIRHIDGKYEVALGTVSSHIQLPGYLWSAFLATDRLYSEQEIAALRTAVPMLQFGRARLSQFTDHGPGHAFRVKAFATQLGCILNLTAEEHHLLRAGAVLHDIGNVVDRERHHIISQETVEKMARAGKLPYNPKEAELVGLLCRWHRREYDPNRTDALRGHKIRTGLLASTLRIADALDIDYRRSDYGKKFREVLAFFFHDELLHWNSLDEIYGVRIHCNPDVNIQVFTKGTVSKNLQIQRLQEDIAGTPLNLRIEEIPVAKAAIGARVFAPEVKTDHLSGQKAVVILPFEPHSLVMAGLSLRNLTASGCMAKTLCYANTSDAPKRLWEETLPDLNSGDCDHLIVVNDRPDFRLTPAVLQTIRALRAQSISIYMLNRHEANWQRAPELIKLGVDIVLGGDWSYFWGNPGDASAFAWGRVASLCTRDPTQSTVEITDEEQAVTRGLIAHVYEAIAQANIKAPFDWGELARPILERITANDFGYFSRKANEFSNTYGKPITPDRIEGKVAIIEQPAGDYPAVNYWMMEATIEKYGRAPVRNMQFNLPYILSIWTRGETVELLAINHWLDDTAIPIRLLYPDQLGPTPRGNECTIRVTIPREKSAAIIQALKNACNQTDN